MYEVLKRHLPQARLRTNENMANHTSFKIGGPAEVYVQPATVDELRQIIALCRDAQAPLTLLGGGTNVLVADTGIKGVVVQTRPRLNEKRVAYNGNGSSNCNAPSSGQTASQTAGRITAEAGLSLAELAETACRAGLAGLPFASGIPGTVGGAVYMNAGAYGYSIGDFCEAVEVLMPTGEVETMGAKDLHFGYRYSILQDNGGIVLSATFTLPPGDPETLRAEARELNARRARSQPLDLHSAGSAFKRPEGYYAGKLIEDSGLKGCQIGGARVSDKHAGFIVNTGNATGDDVRRLIAHVQEIVLARFDVSLEPEIRFIG